MVERVQSADGGAILRLPQVVARTGLSRSTIYDMLNPASRRHDPTFPQSVSLGARSVGWRESAITAWIASRVSANDVSAEPVHQRSKANDDQAAAPPIRENKPVPTDDLREKRTAIVRQILEEHAKRGERMFYDDVMTPIMLFPDNPADCQLIDSILEDISRSFHAEHNILLSALVFESYTGKRRPKDGFFALAKSLGYIYDDPEQFVAQQIIRLYEHFEDPAKKSKGELRWMRIRTKRYLTRAE